MGIAPFRKQGGGTDDEFRKQTNAEVSFQGLRNAFILDGTLLENVAVGTTETLIAHKLGRAIRGYLICNNNTLCTVASTSGTFDKTLFIGLIASSACTLSLWVF
jgi:hypothetical protein